MESEPEFCRDVLETRIKMVFREHLRISRDMPFTQVGTAKRHAAPMNTYEERWRKNVCRKDMNVHKNYGQEYMLITLEELQLWWIVILYFF